MPYEFETIIKMGEGSFGEVYKVKNSDGKEFAIKMVFTKSDAEVEAVLREINVQATFEHENIVKTYKYDIISSNDNNIIEVQSAFPFTAWVIVMELCSSDMRKQLRQRNGIDPQSSASYFRDILNGVNYLHDQRVIHRDLKPENILITYINGRYIFKISDFGLGKVVDTLSPVPASSIKGTPLYMSPEQGSGDNISMKVDIYSLGIILRELYILEPIDQWIKDDSDVDSDIDSDDEWDSNRQFEYEMYRHSRHISTQRHLRRLRRHRLRRPALRQSSVVRQLIRALHRCIQMNQNSEGLPTGIGMLVSRMTQLNPEHRPGCAEIIDEFARL